MGRWAGTGVNAVSPGMVRPLGMHTGALWASRLGHDPVLPPLNREGSPNAEAAKWHG